MVKQRHRSATEMAEKRGRPGKNAQRWMEENEGDKGREAEAHRTDTDGRKGGSWEEKRATFDDRRSNDVMCAVTCERKGGKKSKQNAIWGNDCCGSVVRVLCRLIERREDRWGASRRGVRCEGRRWIDDDEGMKREECDERGGWIDDDEPWKRGTEPASTLDVSVKRISDKHKKSELRKTHRE
jgi:hypothetical protein